MIKQIYKWYLQEGYGTAKIANILNERGLRIKSNCNWSQNAVCWILTNELYTGKIINGKQIEPQMESLLQPLLIMITIRL